MRRIKNQDLASLLMQLRYTPQSKRRDQLAAAEELFKLIQPGREYPFEFIHFRIVGFHPKSPPDQPVVIGDEILDDLAVFIARLSEQIPEQLDDNDEPVFTTDQLAERFGVSTRTIQRWKKRGLIARKTILPDGTKRTAFRQSVVETFLTEHPELVDNAKSFSRVSDEQKRQIIRLARKLAARDISRHQAINQIAAETDRSHEMIRYTIKQYEQINPGRPIFDKPSGPLSSAEAGELYRLYKQNTPVPDLVRQFGVSRSSVYRLVNVRRAKTILAQRLDFVPSDEFPDLDEDAMLSQPLPPTTKPRTASSIPRKVAFDLAAESLPQYLQTLKDTPTLNRESETALFRRYNYLKWLVTEKRDQLKKPTPSSELLTCIEKCIAEAEEIRNHLIAANLRIVVGIARKHTSSSTANMVDLVSEGNLSLVRAVEKFDYTKGFRFGTYASWTISKDFARKIPAETTRPDKARGDLFDRIRRDLPAQATEDLAALERAHQSLAEVINTELDEREQFVILNRFGPIAEPIRKKTMSLREVGEQLGLTKERVRQIELTALQKLRQSLSTEEFELLTGLP